MKLTAASLKKYFDGSIATVHRAVTLRYFLICLCLVIGSFLFCCGIWFAAGQTGMSDSALKISGGFFASLTGFPINDLYEYWRAKNKYQFALDVLDGYGKSRIPQKVVDQLLELTK